MSPTSGASDAARRASRAARRTSNVAPCSKRMPAIPRASYEAINEEMVELSDPMPEKIEDIFSVVSQAKARQLEDGAPTHWVLSRQGGPR